MSRCYKLFLAIQLAGIFVLGGTSFQKATAQNISSNPNYSLGGPTGYGNVGAVPTFSDSNECFGDSCYNACEPACEPVCEPTCSDVCEPTCDASCFDACGTGCYDPCGYNDCGYGFCGGLVPLISDVANVALTPVQWVADLLACGTYADCGCAPKPVRKECDPCDVCGNWVGCDYCGGTGCNACNSCGETVNFGDYNYSQNDWSSTGGDLNQEKYLQQPLPGQVDAPQNIEEIPSDVIKKSKSISTGQTVRRAPQQVALRPSPNRVASPNQRSVLPPGATVRQNQAARQNLTNSGSQNAVRSIPQQQSPQQIQRSPQQVRPLQNPTNAAPAIDSSLQNSIIMQRPAANDRAIAQNKNNGNVMLALPNLNDETTANDSQKATNAQAARQKAVPVFYQSARQQNQIVQVGKQIPTNGNSNNIRPVNFDANRPQTNQKNYIPVQQTIAANGNAGQSNGNVQMIIVPKDQIQTVRQPNGGQSPQVVYVQQQQNKFELPKIQSPSKLNRSFGK